MAVRISVAVGLLLLAFIAPWWLTAASTLLALIYFNNFYEAVVIGLVIDSIFGFAQAGFLNLSLPFTLVFFLAVIFANLAKKYVVAEFI